MSRETIAGGSGRLVFVVQAELGLAGAGTAADGLAHTWRCVSAARDHSGVAQSESDRPGGGGGHRGYQQSALARFVDTGVGGLLGLAS